MTAITLLSRLRRLGAELSVQGDEIICRSPRGVLTAELRDALRASRSEVLAILRDAPASFPAPPEGIGRTDEQGELSHAQQRLWFLDRWSANRELYNVSEAFEVEGRILPAGVRYAVGEIVRRHEVLRTRFVAEDGRPRAVVDSAGEAQVEYADFRGVLPKRAAADAKALRQASARRPFDLEKGPLLRVLLVQLAEERFELVVTLHHIVSDAWSMSVLLREMSAYYRVYETGGESGLPELAAQYGDYAGWQRRRAGGKRLQEDLEYWRERLRGVPVLELPGDRPRPAVQTHEGGLKSLLMPGALKRQLEELSRAEGATLFMTLITAFHILLYRYTGSEDIATGTVVSNRPRPEVENLIGMFVNTLVLRSDLGGEPSFRDLLRQMRRVTLAAFAHQEAPFEYVVEQLQPQRDLSHTVLFQTMFVYQRALGEELQLGSSRVKPLGSDNGGAKFDITMIATEAAEWLAVTLEYRKDLYDESSMGRLLGHYENLLREIVAAPGKKIGRLGMLGEEERAQLIRGWSGGGEAPAGERLGLAEKFRRAAATHGQRVAVACGGAQMTYAELDAQSGRLANYLGGLGVGPEVCVGLCVGASCELIVGILGILKAGGAYVPLDPALPTARLEYIAADSGVSLIVTGKTDADGGQGERGPEFAGRREISLSEETWRSCSPVSPDTRCDERQLAYVIYTSGSTGKPKGVGVTHANVTRLFGVTEGWGGFGAEDVWTLYHSYGFDFSVWEIWGALLYGGRLEVVPYWVRRSPEQFHKLLEEAGVTVLNMTPSAFRQLRGYAGGWGSLAVRLVMFGGEQLRYEELRGWAQNEGAGVRLVNLYGITETTVHVTRCEVGEGELSGARGAAIGGPLDDLRMYVLDERMEPVPLGVTGELYVGGGGVARGYLGRPGLTAARFVPDQWGGERGGRLYRTGDVVRYLGPGEYTYEGRADRQVKIRGHRLELGEVEAALLAEPGIREAVVEQLVDEQGWERLVAYLVGEAPGDPEQLRHALARQLPEYMVPASYEWLKEMPLTAHGKTDRAALPKPTVGRGLGAASYVGPQTQAQKALAEVWEQALGVGPVGIHDSFFSLGGDSIRSLQVQARAARRGVRFSLEQLFRHPTVYGLTAAIESAGGKEEESSRLPQTRPFSLIAEEDRRLLPPDIEDAYPLTRLQAGMLYHIILAPDSNIYHNTDSVRIQLPDIFIASHFTDAVVHVAARHAVLRTSFMMTGLSQPMQLVHRTHRIDVKSRDLQDLDHVRQQDVIDAIVAREKLRPFDLTRPGLIRVFVHILAPRTIQLTITECHAILDGWSWHSTLVEIFELYSARLRGEPDAPPRAPDPAQPTFRDYVALEQRALASTEFSQFWREHLADAPVLRLTMPRHRVKDGAARETPRIESRSFPIPPALQAELRKAAESLGAGLKSVALAAHVGTLARLCGESDVVTGVQVNGRPEGWKSEELRGLFLNVIPLRVRAGQIGWGELVRRCLAAELQTFPRRRHPLAQIQRDNGGRSLFEVTFNFLDFHVLGSLASGVEIGEGKRSEGTETPLAVLAHPHLIEIDFDANLVLGEYAETFGRCMLKALTAIACNPCEPIDVLPLLGETERQQFLATSAGANQAFPPEPIASQFEIQVRRDPSAPAVAFDGSTLSYAELNSGANRLARLLLAAGAGPGRVVAICLDRSPALMRTIFAILKTGAAFLPLDSGQPSLRLERMLVQARPVVTVTSASLQSRLPDRAGLIVPDTPETLALLQHTSDLDLAGEERVPAAPDDAAYVMYTSGSTGEPKGVVITHRGICNRIHWMLEEFGFSACDRVLQKTPYSFDASVWELVAPLLVGGCVVLAEPGGHRDPGYLVKTMIGERITVLQVVPSLLEALVEEPELSRCSALRQVFCAGEVLAEVLAEKLHARLAVALCNTYGPTEAAIDVTYWRWTRRTETIGVPIGRPITNTRTYVLDEKLNPVPAGVKGELYVAGAGLARGYLGRAGQTAEKFIPCPFGSPGERMYRTGDLVRWGAEAVLEFAGRADSQLKIRGVRVEPGEVEAAILRNELVSQAVVTVREHDLGGKQLVAFVILKRKDALDSRTLRTFLASVIPQAMIPSAFVFADRLPLTSSGKLDGAALPAVTAESHPPASAELPRTAEERIIAEVWQQVLGVDRIGIRDSFFDLGGDSLLSLQVVSRLHQRGIRATSRLIFEQASIEKLARAVSATAPATAEQGLVTGSVPLTPAQHWFFGLDLQRPSYWNQSVTLDIPAVWTCSVVREALGRLVIHHDALRLRFEGEGGARRQWHAPYEAPPVALLTENDDGFPDSVARAAVATQTEFSLSSGSMLRAIYVKRPQRYSARLILIAHHLVIDEVSWKILMADLEVLCDGLAAAVDPVLPRKTSSFRYWAEKLLAHTSSGAVDAEISRWLAAARDAHEHLPRDRSEGNNREGNADAVIVHLDEERSRFLTREFSAAQNYQILEALLAGLVRVLCDWTGRTSVVVDLETHGREDLFEDVDLSRTVGWFTGVWPVRLKYNPAAPPSPPDTLAAVSGTLKSVANHGIGHGLLRYLRGDNDVSASLAKAERPEVVFNYLGHADSSPAEDSLPRRVASAAGFVRDPSGERTHLLEVNVRVAAGRLETAWIYGTQIHDRSTIARVAAAYVAAVADIVDLSRGAGLRGLPVPLPALVSEQELDAFDAAIPGGD